MRGIKYREAKQTQPKDPVREFGKFHESPYRNDAQAIAAREAKLKQIQTAIETIDKTERFLSGREERQELGWSTVAAAGVILIAISNFTIKTAEVKEWVAGVALIVLSLYKANKALNAEATTTNPKMKKSIEKNEKARRIIFEALLEGHFKDKSPKEQENAVAKIENYLKSMSLDKQVEAVKKINLEGLITAHDAVERLNRKFPEASKETKQLTGVRVVVEKEAQCSEIQMGATGEAARVQRR